MRYPGFSAMRTAQREWPSPRFGMLELMEGIAQMIFLEMTDRG